mmetsp:Transcript_26271/g.87537  ORF Transcript_26271/g.87537 Transcript_26271/m.87537 type:complete len:277 (+) Transcript_26271:93-923(+)
METHSRLIGGRLGRSSDIAGQPTAADISLAQQMVRGQDEQVLGVFRPTQSEAAKASAHVLLGPCAMWLFPCCWPQACVCTPIAAVLAYWQCNTHLKTLYIITDKRPARRRTLTRVRAEHEFLTLHAGASARTAGRSATQRVASPFPRRRQSRTASGPPRGRAGTTLTFALRQGRLAATPQQGRATPACRAGGERRAWRSTCGRGPLRPPRWEQAQAQHGRVYTHRWHGRGKRPGAHSRRCCEGPGALPPRVPAANGGHGAGGRRAGRRLRRPRAER